MCDALILPDERIEDLQNGYQIIQNPKFFMFGTDAVLLSHFAAAEASGHVVDLGTGGGIIPLLLLARRPGLTITGIEVQPELAAMAQRSVAFNGLERQIRIVCGDIKNVLAYEKQGADMVVTNPPYIKKGAGAENASMHHNIAKREEKCTLDDILTAAAALLKTGGGLCLIYPTQRFAELMAAMRAKRIEPKRIQLIAPRHGKAPNFGLVEGRKNAREGVTFLQTLEVYQKDGGYTEPLRQIYGIGEDMACSTSSRRP